MAEQMEKYEEVYWKTIEYAKETAREAGLKEGQVLAFLKMNLPITEIMKHTGLSEEEIQKIKIHYNKNRLESHIHADSKRLIFRIVLRQPHQEFLQARYPSCL